MQMHDHFQNIWNAIIYHQQCYAKCWILQISDRTLMLFLVRLIYSLQHHIFLQSGTPNFK